MQGYSYFIYIFDDTLIRKIPSLGGKKILKKKKEKLDDLIYTAVFFILK